MPKRNQTQSPRETLPSAKPRRRQNQPLSVVSFDHAVDGCEKIAALAELLESCRHAEWLRAEAVSRIGTMIRNETESLQALLDRFHAAQKRKAK